MFCESSDCRASAGASSWQPCPRFRKRSFSGLMIQITIPVSYRMETKELNILLMGETGVGKSTFINSFANYIQHSTFSEAKKHKALVPVPTLINVYDEDKMEDITMKVGNDENESHKVGKSQTKHPKTYIFPVEGKNLVINMIDTPGLGDTDGCKQDDENVENVLQQLTQLKNLSAICLLMKPSNDRDTVLFGYCVRRILSQLHKSAAQNIVFIFTNTKGADYRPGPTIPILKNIRDKIAETPPHVKVKIEKENLFCLDNESFKNLLALEEGIKICDMTLTSCENSWALSCKEIQRFISYIQRLPPHNTKDTVSVTRTQNLIYELSKPMSEVYEILQVKISELKVKQEESKNKEYTIEELQKKLMKPGIDIEIVSLDNPVLVCAECATTVQVGNAAKTNYTQRCHDPCLTGKVAYEIIGHWSLAFCSEMKYNWEWNMDCFCVHCGCSFKKHMTIFYDTKLVQKDFVDEDVQKDLQSEEKIRDKIQKKLMDIERETKELNDEFQFIKLCAAKFACYLENNSITSCYDSFKEYIHLSLQKQKGLGNQANMTIVANLNQLLKEHEQLILSFRDKKAEAEATEITDESVNEDIIKLLRLKYAGKKIKEMYDSRINCAKAASKYSMKKMFTKSIPNWFSKNF